MINSIFEITPNNSPVQLVSITQWTKTGSNDPLDICTDNNDSTFLDSPLLLPNSNEIVLGTRHNFLGASIVYPTFAFHDPKVIVRLRDTDSSINLEISCNLVWYLKPFTITNLTPYSGEDPNLYKMSANAQNTPDNFSNLTFDFSSQSNNIPDFADIDTSSPYGKSFWIELSSFNPNIQGYNLKISNINFTFEQGITVSPPVSPPPVSPPVSPPPVSPPVSPPPVSPPVSPPPVSPPVSPPPVSPPPPISPPPTVFNFTILPDTGDKSLSYADISSISIPQITFLIGTQYNPSNPVIGQVGIPTYAPEATKEGLLTPLSGDMQVFYNTINLGILSSNVNFNNSGQWLPTSAYILSPENANLAFFVNFQNFDIFFNTGHIVSTIQNLIANAQLALTGLNIISPTVKEFSPFNMSFNPTQGSIFTKGTNGDLLSFNGLIDLTPQTGVQQFSLTNGTIETIGGTTLKLTIPLNLYIGDSTNGIMPYFTVPTLNVNCGLQFYISGQIVAEVSF